MRIFLILAIILLPCFSFAWVQGDPQMGGGLKELPVPSTDTLLMVNDTDKVYMVDDSSHILLYRRDLSHVLMVDEASHILLVDGVNKLLNNQ